MPGNQNFINDQEVVTKEVAREMISEKDKDGKLLFDKAEKLGNAMNQVKQAQLRKIYSEFRRIQMNFKNDVREEGLEKAQEKCKYELRHLKAMLMYAKARKPEITPFCNSFTRLIDTAIEYGPGTPLYGNGDIAIDRLKDFFEAVLVHTKQR